MWRAKRLGLPTAPQGAAGLPTAPALCEAIMNPILAVGDVIDGDPSPSASSGVSSANPATISASSLACEASARLNFLSHPPTPRKWVGTEGLILVFYSVEHLDW